MRECTSGIHLKGRDLGSDVKEELAQRLKLSAVPLSVCCMQLSDITGMIRGAIRLQPHRYIH